MSTIQIIDTEKDLGYIYLNAKQPRMARFLMVKQTPDTPRETVTVLVSSFFLFGLFMSMAWVLGWLVSQVFGMAFAARFSSPKQRMSEQLSWRGHVLSAMIGLFLGGLPFWLAGGMPFCNPHDNLLTGLLGDLVMALLFPVGIQLYSLSNDFRIKWQSE